MLEWRFGVAERVAAAALTLFARKRTRHAPVLYARKGPRTLFGWDKMRSTLHVRHRLHLDSASSCPTEARTSSEPC